MVLYRFFLSTVFIVLAINGYCQKDWVLKKEKNGINVFTKDLDSSKFSAIKVEAVLNGKLNKLNSIIRDVMNHKKWIYSTKNSHLIKSISGNEIMYYAETTLPWPFKNRDVVIDMTLNMDITQRTLIIHSHSVDNVLPVKSGIVRIPSLITDWNVHEDSLHNLHIIYYFITDPGGGLSPWLVNTFSVKGPYETFSSLAKLLSE